MAVNSPHKILPFGRKPTYGDALQRQQDCQKEKPSPVMQSMQTVKAWLDAGEDPLLARARMADTARGAILEAADDLSRATTPEAAIAFMEKVAEQMRANKS